MSTPETARRPEPVGQPVTDPEEVVPYPKVGPELCQVVGGRWSRFHNGLEDEFLEPPGGVVDPVPDVVRLVAVE